MLSLRFKQPRYSKPRGRVKTIPTAAVVVVVVVSAAKAVARRQSWCRRGLRHDEVCDCIECPPGQDFDSQ